MSSFELPVARGTLTSWSKPGGEPPSCVWTATRDTQGEAAGAGLVQPGEDKEGNLAAVSLHERRHAEGESDVHASLSLTLPISRETCCSSPKLWQRLLIWNVPREAGQGHWDQ